MVEESLWKQLDAETLAFCQQPDLPWQEQERFALEEFTERLHRSFVGREALVEKALEFALSPVSEGTDRVWCVTAESGALSCEDGYPRGTRVRVRLVAAADAVASARAA